jgi:hypothetical protein
VRAGRFHANRFWLERHRSHYWGRIVPPAHVSGWRRALGAGHSGPDHGERCVSRGASPLAAFGDRIDIAHTLVFSLFPSRCGARAAALFKVCLGGGLRRHLPCAPNAVGRRLSEMRTSDESNVPLDVWRPSAGLRELCRGAMRGGRASSRSEYGWRCRWDGN